MNLERTSSLIGDHDILLVIVVHQDFSDVRKENTGRKTKN